MSDESFTIQRLIKLRKLTRAIGDVLRGQLTDYLATLSPVLRPKGVFGEYVRGGTKDAAPRSADKNFLQLQTLYTAVATAKPYGLLGELRSPADLDSSAVEIFPSQYSHAAVVEGVSRTVSVTSPFRWVLAYSGYSPEKLQSLLLNNARPDEETHRFVLHHCMLHVVLASQPGVARLFEALRFRLSSGRLQQFGDLPISQISSLVATVRPPDDLIVDTTEISGQNTFEEVVDLESLRRLEDPLRGQLVELAKSHGEDF
jgi:hypothetical protein